MGWVDGFYSRTGEWWGNAESVVSDDDRYRALVVAGLLGATGSLLELGCGYGSTATACAATGIDVVAIDLSDRVREAVASGTSNPQFIHGDFHTADVGGPFDAVTYWDGFGVGSDDDQRQLLGRIGGAWLKPGGVAIIDVFDPVWWSSQAGFEENRPARPDDGYAYSLGHRRDFDAEGCRALDSWWEQGSDEVITQSLRCYRPDELANLVVGTGLVIRQLDRSEEPAPSYRVQLSLR